MDLTTWVQQEYDGIDARFRGAIVTMVPPERWKERAQQAGSSIASLVFHTTVHADYALSCVIGATTPIAADHRTAMGLAGIDPHRGLGESEDLELTAALDIEALLVYYDAVNATGRSALADGAANETTADVTRLSEMAAVDESQVPWLFSMWTGKPVSWFVQWEAIGHRLNHLGEMINVRSRLGLSPF